MPQNRRNMDENTQILDHTHAQIQIQLHKYKYKHIQTQIDQLFVHFRRQKRRR